jgi:hypothetical protein
LIENELIPVEKNMFQNLAFCISGKDLETLIKFSKDNVVKLKGTDPFYELFYQMSEEVEIREMEKGGKRML